MTTAYIPQHLGTWILGVGTDNKIVTWGDKDNEWPYPPDNINAKKQIGIIRKDVIKYTLYFLYVYSNGQVRLFEYPYEDS